MMVFPVTKVAWEGWNGENIHIGKILSRDGQTALFFTCNGSINYRVAMGVAGSYARHTDATWDEPF